MNNMPIESQRMLKDAGWRQTAHNPVYWFRRGDPTVATYSFDAALDEQVLLLKRQWRMDPTWDLEATPGFEPRREKLKKYAQRVREMWALETVLEELADDLHDLKQQVRNKERRSGLLREILAREKSDLGF